MDIIEINHLLIYSKYVNKLHIKNQYKLYNEYFHDLMHLFPSNNDSINLPEYKHLNHLQENPFDERHILKQKEIYKKYIEKLSKIKNNLHNN